MDLLTRKTSLGVLGLERCGAVHENLPPARLVEAAVRRREAMLAGNGAIVVRTGKRTGRSPKDRFIVEDELTRDRVAWGDANRPFSRERFSALLEKATAYLSVLEELWAVDAVAGADPRYGLNVRVVCEHAWQALFARQLFRRPGPEGLDSFEPDWTVLSVPGFLADPEEDGTNSETFVGVDFTRRVVLVCGTAYAGEIKKSIFSVLNFVLPVQFGVLPMHCSANVGEGGDVALFFGLSGTGKTTLAADPERRLIGDDEHGWSEDEPGRPGGVFNFEGGCYAKAIDLSPEKEPQIHRAVRFGTVLENVAVDRRTREVDFSDVRATENTRAAYPLEHIDGAVPEGRDGHPENVVFLTADAFGVLPPISLLTPEQAAYWFLSGYTSKLAGTEADMEEAVQPTFSACFGAPFLPLAPTRYALMLRKRLDAHGSRVWLVNTGWTGGPYGVGRRIDLVHTRAMVRAVLAGELRGSSTVEEPYFGLAVPSNVPGVPDKLLKPRSTWRNPNAYDARARELAVLFRANFARFEAEFEEAVSEVEPGILEANFDATAD
jgi:phosphoenolpyruvate carboxykinase (ATP)